jgi:hypothetical protein
MKYSFLETVSYKNPFFFCNIKTARQADWYKSGRVGGRIAVNDKRKRQLHCRKLILDTVAGMRNRVVFFAKISPLAM